MASGVESFAWPLYLEMISGESSNFCMSSWSITTALSISLLGARGTTRQAMMKTMNIADDQAHHQLMQKMTSLLNETDGVTLTVANKLFCSSSLRMLDQFKEDCVKLYDAPSSQLNFSDGDSACAEINNWVSSKTAGKITKLLTAEDVDANTLAVLLNAIYFKGIWLNRFKDIHTTTSTFKKLDGSKIKTNMMFQRTNFKLGHSYDMAATALFMPYVNAKAEMVVILPKQDNGLPDLEKKLTSENVNNLEKFFKATSEVLTEVSLPRFTVDALSDMQKVLQNLGMGEIFEEKADFSGIANDVRVSKVVHRAYVDVNEEGTEAAAVTAVIKQSRCMPCCVPFLADHPFLFFIRHVESKTLLFIGRVTEPSEATL